MANLIDANFIRNLKSGTLVNFDTHLAGICIDSRKVEKGTLFVALKGDNVDGHLFVKDALNKGAVLCLVSEKWAKENNINSNPFWIVKSPEKTLQLMAAEWRNQFNLPILAITGTNGKTTTRAMIEAILKTKFNLHSTTGNLNNQLGLPLTLLKLNKNHNFSLIEMGTNHFGEIKFLCELAKPSAGLITNIGYGHIEFFDTLDGVSKAKEELFLSLPRNGISFVNMDDLFIREMTTPDNKVSYGINSTKADVYGKIISYTDECYPLLEINNKLQIQLKIPGEVTALNALAAISVGLHYKIPDFIIKETLENFTAVKQRFVTSNIGTCKIIDDTYNANPDSTIAALNTLSLMKVQGRRIFVFGDMLELGKSAEEAHAKVGKSAAELRIDIFYAFGPLSMVSIKEAKYKGMKNAYHFTNKIKLIKALKNEINSTDTLLVKGSRGTHMEEIIKGIKN